MRCPSLHELPPPPPGCTGWPWTAEGTQLPDKMPNGAPWPRISIVTPSYNQAKYLEATIRSILLQGYPDLEYIIMDGGSTDGSLEIIHKYVPWLAHWESIPDDGQYAAVDKGFSLTHGEIMAWLNSDDLYFPWTLKTVGEIFGSFSMVDWLTTSNIATTAHDGNATSFSNVTGYSQRSFTNNRNLRKKPIFMQQESTFWRYRLWEKAGGKMNSQLHYAGDFELWIRFIEHTSPVTTNIPLGIFRYHGEQKTNIMGKYIDEAETILKKFPKPMWIPNILIRVVRYPLKKLNPDVNWFGTRCDTVKFSPQLNQWQYIKSFIP